MLTESFGHDIYNVDSLKVLVMGKDSADVAGMLEKLLCRNIFMSPYISLSDQSPF